MHQQSQSANDPRYPHVPVLVAYDGSDHARHAVEWAGAFFPGRPAIVLHVWEPVELAAIRRGVIGMSTTTLERELDTSADEAARVAAEGAEIARRAGLVAEARTVQALPSTWEAIVHAADQMEAAVIIIGSRGLRGLRSLVLGSVAQQVVQHATQPVLVVPSPALVDVRRNLGLRRNDHAGVA